MRRAKGEMQIKRFGVVGKKVVRNSDDGAEFSLFQKTAHHFPEAGGDIAFLFRLRRCDRMAAGHGMIQRPFGDRCRTGKRRGQIRGVGVLVAAHRCLLTPVNDTLVGVLATRTLRPCPLACRRRRGLDRKYCR